MSNDSLIDAIRDSEDADFVPIWQVCREYTTTSVERGLSIFRATRFIVQNRIPGAFVECGIRQSGSTMIAMKTLQLLEAASRRFILFDSIDEAKEPQRRSVIEKLQAEIVAVGYDESKVRFRKGDVRRVLARSSVPGISLLLVDAISYEKMCAALTYLYPRLAHRGVLILDDFSREGEQAVDDYFGEVGPAPGPRPLRPFFHRIDVAGRIAVRPDPSEEELPAELARDPAKTWAKPTRDGVQIPALEERYDYVPPGLTNPELIRNFPSLVANDPRRNKWPYLRSAAPHIWRVDERSLNQNIGVLSLEEAILLHHLALPYAGQRGLAVGCHYAWSTAHLLAADLHLDVVDPKLSRDDQCSDVHLSLSAIRSRGSFRLWAAYSPSIIPALRETQSAPWSFAFIDGDHEGDAPRRDAQTIAQFCASDATVVLHDLISPHVAAGLEVFQAAGWNVRIYNTMQVLGVAWRGQAKPVEHTSDPRMPPLDLPHLRPFLNRA